MATLRAVIFDVDGVLVDSYRAHLRSWQELGQRLGYSLTDEQFAESFGRTSREIIRHYWDPAATMSDSLVDEHDAWKEACYRRIIAEEFPAMDGAVELIDALRDAGLQLAVGSSAPPENVTVVLEQLDRQQAFAATVNKSDVQRGKPDPQVFLLAAQRLGIAAGKCVVIEDAPVGIQAATAAGMASVALLSTGRQQEHFRDARPSLIVHSLRELTLAVLASLF